MGGGGVGEYYHGTTARALVVFEVKKWRALDGEEERKKRKTKKKNTVRNGQIFVVFLRQLGEINIITWYSLATKVSSAPRRAAAGVLRGVGASAGHRGVCAHECSLRCQFDGLCVGVCAVKGFTS